MAIRVTIKADKPKVLDQFEVVQVLARVLFRAGERIAGEAKEIVPVDTGALRSSIRAEQPTIKGGIIGVDIVGGGSQAPYGLVVHEGRRPGAKMPPINAIAGWVKRKGFVRGKGKRRGG